MPANVGRWKRCGLIPGWGRSPGGAHSNPLQYSCLENPMDIEAWWAKGHRVAQKRTQLKRLSTHSMHQNCCLNIPTGLLFQQLLLQVSRLGCDLWTCLSVQISGRFFALWHPFSDGAKKMRWLSVCPDFSYCKNGSLTFKPFKCLNWKNRSLDLYILKQ